MIAELNRYPGSLLAITFSTIVKHIKIRYEEQCIINV